MIYLGLYGMTTLLTSLYYNYNSAAVFTVHKEINNNFELL